MALGGKHSLPGFERSLEELRSDIILMATLVRRSLRKAKTGFAERDEDDCSAVIADDEEVDLLEKQVDRAGTNILIRFQPLASDFRTVLASIKLASHLENVSDQAMVMEKTAWRLRKSSKDILSRPARRCRRPTYSDGLYRAGAAGLSPAFQRREAGLPF